MYRFLQRFTLLLFFLVSIASVSYASFPSSNAKDSVVVFKFMARNDTFWASYRGNEKEFARLADFLQNNRGIIMAKSMPVLVRGYCSSFDDLETNRKIGRQRSNHVKSFIITNHGLSEDNFKTINYTNSLNGESDVVTLTFTISAKDVYKLVSAVVAQEVVKPTPRKVLEPISDAIVTPVKVDTTRKLIYDEENGTVSPRVFIAPPSLAPVIDLQTKKTGVAERREGNYIPNANTIHPVPLSSSLKAPNFATPDVVQKVRVEKPIKVKNEKPAKVKSDKSIKSGKAKPSLVVASAPVVAKAAKPIKVKQEKPVKIKAEKPAKVKAEKSVKVKSDKSVKSANAKPSLVVASAPVVAKAAKPIKVKQEKPVKIKAEKPAKVKAEKSVKVKSANAKPSLVVASAPVVAKAAKPIKVKAEKPVKVKADKPVKVKAEKPIKVVAQKPAKVEKPQSIKTVKPQLVRIVKPEHKLAVQPKSTIEFELKTNLLYLLATAPNIEGEILFKQKLSLNLEYQFAHTDFNGGQNRLRLSTFSPEIRYYPIRGRLFVGAYYNSGLYNVKLSADGYQGAFNGGGITIGYKLPVTKSVGFEFSISGGYAWTVFDKYHFDDGCNRFDMSNHVNYYGPTKAKVSFVWRIGGAKK